MNESEHPIAMSDAVALTNAANRSLLLPEGRQHLEVKPGVLGATRCRLVPDGNGGVSFATTFFASEAAAAVLDVPAHPEFVSAFDEDDDDYDEFDDDDDEEDDEEEADDEFEDDEDEFEDDEEEEDDEFDDDDEEEEDEFEDDD